MGGSKSPVLFLAALATVVVAAPAHAQCRLCETPTTTLSSAPDADGIVLQVETSLDFDRLILAGQGQGAAVIRPDGSNSTEGAVAAVSPRAMVGTATVHGAPDKAIRVELPSRVDLYSVNGGGISMDEIVSDLSSLPRLDSAGNLSFRFGGRVRISGDADGDYRGDLPITVEYQ